MEFTVAEIESQPQIWRRALAERTAEATRLLARPGERVLILGCGTSAFLAHSFAHLREGAGLGWTDWAYASEPWPWRGYDAVIALSRSGTTTEVIAAIDRVPDGVPVVAVTGVAGSPVAGSATDVLLLDFADERSVVQTRFPTTFLLLARNAFGEDVTSLPGAVAAAISESLPVDVADYEHFVYLGSGWSVGLAEEAALKVRESAQAWAESYPMLDYRHGPLAVAGPRSLVWLLGPVDDSLVADIDAVGATVVRSTSDPLVELVKAQRLAVAIAAHRGLDPDVPRNLTRAIVLG